MLIRLFKIFFILITFLSFYQEKVQAHDDLMDKLISQIDKFVEIEKNASAKINLEFRREIINQIETNPKLASDRLIKEIKKTKISEKRMAVYVWAVGFTKSPDILDDLIIIYRRNKNELVRQNILRSIARIGGVKAGEYLLSQTVDDSSYIGLNVRDKENKKFELLNLLGEMQYTPALPVMGGLLQKDYKRFYWQPTFCFGKMGNKAISYLLGKINDPNTNVRFNSISVLGNVLLALEASNSLQKRYWIETDSYIKALILSMLERLIYDFNEMERFFQKVEAKETNEDLRRFAQETLDGLNSYKKRIAGFKSIKKDNRELFENEYNLFYDSTGREGSIDSLGILSRYEDENRLERLREKLLRRNSDECLYECDKLNRIIILNRFIAMNKKFE